MPVNNTVRVMARNVSGGAFDLAAATLSVAVTQSPFAKGDGAGVRG